MISSKYLLLASALILLLTLIELFVNRQEPRAGPGILSVFDATLTPHPTPALTLNLTPTRVPAFTETSTPQLTPLSSPTEVKSPIATRDSTVTEIETSSAPNGEVRVSESVITLNAYPYDSFWSDVLDPTYNIIFKKFDAAAYNSAPHTPSPRSFKMVTLENEYLRLTFLPELGGRLWQILYKPTGQTLLYNNPVLKPSRWGPTKQGFGWLAAGGMEWALPVNEHGYEWGVPWKYAVTQGTDGSATITLRDSDAPDRVRAQISVTLAPGTSFFTLHPRIENLRSVSVPVQFWVNAQLNLNEKNVSPDTEFVLPTHQVFVHTTGDSFIPPENIPGNHPQAPVTPMPWSVVAGHELSMYSGWDTYLGVFVPSPISDFAGAYSHTAELGIARVFPKATAPGVKLFGLGPNTTFRDSFTDDDSDYFELWGGLPRTFFANDDVALAPGEAREWDEEWIPFAQTGGVTAATRKAVLNLTVETDSNVAVSAVATMRDTRGVLVLERNGAEIHRWNVTLNPGNPFHAQVKAGAGTFQLRLVDEDGTVLAESGG